MAVTLNLFPDLLGDRVWLNLRRIQDWAQERRQELLASNPNVTELVLLPDPYDEYIPANLMRIEKWSRDWLPGLELDYGDTEVWANMRRIVEWANG